MVNGLGARRAGPSSINSGDINWVCLPENANLIWSPTAEEVADIVNQGHQIARLVDGDSNLDRATALGVAGTNVAEFPEFVTGAGGPPLAPGPSAGLVVAGVPMVGAQGPGKVDASDSEQLKAMNELAAAVAALKIQVSDPKGSGSGKDKDKKDKKDKKASRSSRGLRRRRGEGRAGPGPHLRTARAHLSDGWKALATARCPRASSQRWRWSASSAEPT